MTSTTLTPQELRAKETLRRAAAGLEGGTVAGISEIVKLVEALAANALNISVAELAELVEKDVVVTAKVVAAANTLGYNPSGVEVSSITQAIHVIGFAKIRLLALSLMLMENAERSQGAAAQRDTATLALTSGMMAQAWAEGQGRGDAEQAFLCAALRNFGRLLITAVMPDDDRLARRQGEVTGDPDAAYREVLGLTPLELGYELLKSSNLPEPLLQGLRQFSPTMLEAATLHPSDELLVAAEFSVRVSQLALQANLTSSQFNDASRDLLRQFGKHLRLDGDQLKAMFERAEQRMTAFGHAFGLQSMSRGVTAKLSARRQSKPPPDAPAVAAPLAAPAGAGGPSPGPDGRGVPGAPDSTGGSRVQQTPTDAPASPAQANAPASSGAKTAESAMPPSAAAPERERRPLLEVLHDAVARCAELLGQPVVSDEAVAGVVTQALAEGCAADEVVLLLERGKGSFATLAGAGKRWRDFRQKVGFRRDERNVLGVAVARCEPVLIHDAADPKIDPYLPPWLKAGLQLYSCIIIPGGDANSSHSVVFVGWRVRQKVSVAPEELRSIRALLGMVVTARRLAGVG